jgi:peptidoglycan/LPS O-acetylase OafA/YrhL
MSDGAENRTKALDGLRGLAVLQVVIFHYYLLLPIDTDGYLLLRRLGSVIDGLTLFFVLSGFLIGRILLEARDTPGMFRTFYWRRACRILPLYFLLLATYGVVRFVDQRWRIGLLEYWFSEFPIWNYLVFWQNERMVRDVVIGAPWLAVTWSLAVEMQFYLLAPWVVRYVSGRTLIGLCLACVVAGPFVRSTVRDYLLIDRLDALAAGVLLAALLREAACRAVLARSRTLLRVLVAAHLAALVALRVANGTSPFLNSQTTSAMVYAGLIYLLVEDMPWPVCKPAIELFSSFGLISFFLYLFHMPVSYLLETFYPSAKALALPVTVGLAALSYRYFETPFLRIGRRLPLRGADS